MGSKRKNVFWLILPERLTYFITFMFLAVIIVQNYIVLGEMEKTWLIIPTVLAGIWCAGIYVWKKCGGKISDSSKAVWCIVCISFLVRLCYIIAVPTTPTSDFKILLDAAQLLLQGDYSWYNQTYFQWYPYQIPFVTYEALVLWLFNSVFAIKFINILFMVGINVLVYCLSKRIASQEAAFVVAILYAVYPASVMFSSVLTNQHIATFFALLSIYFVLKSHHFFVCVLAGMLLCISNLMRPEAILIFAAYIVYSFFLLIEEIWNGKQECSKSNTRQKMVGILILIISYILFNGIAQTIYTKSGVAPNGIGNERPEWKFVLGLNPLSVGKFSKMNIDIMYIEDDNERSKEMVRVIKENFQTYEKSVFSFLGEKSKNMWGERDSAYWSVHDLDMKQQVNMGMFETSIGNLVNCALRMEKSIYILVFWFSGITCFYHVFKRRLKKEILFYVLLFAETYSAYLLIEIQQRYRYGIMPALFVLSAFGIDVVYKKLSRI